MAAFSDITIDTTADVARFFDILVREMGVNVHPDDDFSEYINRASGKPSFTTEEAKEGNRLMRECFEVCEKEGTDIYAVGLSAFCADSNVA